jgi:hypothetical protein
MCLEADGRVCMLDRAGASNALVRLSTTTMQWEQLDASRVSGSPPSARYNHGMVAVGSDLYVFGGMTNEGDTRHCDAGRRLGAWQIDRRRCSARCCGACWHMLCSSGVPWGAMRLRWCTGGPAEDSIVMCLEADRRVCMLDRAGALMSELFRFSTTTMQWEQLDASRVSGSPQNVGFDCMVAVGSDLYVFGGFTAEGDTRLCDAGRRLGA